MCNDMSREKRRCVLTAGENYCFWYKIFFVIIAGDFFFIKKTTVCTRQTVAVKNRKWECLIIRKRILILANGVPVISTF